MKTIATLLLFASFFTSIAQNALSFDGVDDKVDLGNPAALQITGNTMTIEAWIYPTSWRTNVWEGGIVVKEMNSSNNGYMFRAGNSGRLNFAFGANGLPWQELTSAANTLSLNTWQHVAATYNGSKVRLFVNGVKVDSASSSGNIGNAVNNCVIGGWYSTGRNFPGKIDEVRIWNIARTPSQIAASANGEFCGAPAGLVAYYKFSQGTASGNNAGLTTLNDLAGNNNGTLQNFALSGNTSNWVSGAPLSVGTGGSGTATVSACDSYTSLSGNVYTTSGTYVDTLLSPLGCDSVLTINLTINASNTGTTSATACNTYRSPSGNHVWNVSGIYYDVLTNASGCDSVLTINLTINNVDTNVFQNGATLTAWASNATYQWLDCNNGNAPIAGATNQTFTATANGSYAVAINKNNCTDTSACYTVTGVGLYENNIYSGVSFYPNPVQNVCYLSFNRPFSGKMSVLNTQGQVLQTEALFEASTYEWTVKNLPRGYYVLRFEQQNDVFAMPIVVE